MNQRLKPLGMHGGHFNVKDGDKFKAALKLLRESLFDGGATLFEADNLITWNRNLSFLRDDFFIDIIKRPGASVLEKSIVWRSYILLYFAEIAAGADGDFVELGCHEGTTADLITRRLDLGSLGKKLVLYDLFEWKPGDGHTHLPELDDPDMHKKVVARFSDRPFVHVIKGRVPDSLAEGFPEKIAFAHIDMNHPTPEAGALEAVLPRLSKGGAVVFDDYGWWHYSSQKIALDPIAAAHGLKILELPTGQGLLLSP